MRLKASFAVRSEEMAERWGAERSVLAVGDDMCGIRYPACQLDEQGGRPETLPRIMSEVEGWTACRVLLSPQPAFNGTTGRKVLTPGRIEGLIVAARNDWGDFY